MKNQFNQLRVCLAMAGIYTQTKKLIRNTLIILVVITAMSFEAVTQYELRQNTAEVQKMDGYYIFYKSEPVMPFEKMGNVSFTFAPAQAKDCLSKLLEKAKSKYPSGNGLLLDENIYSADVIKIEK